MILHDFSTSPTSFGQSPTSPPSTLLHDDSMQCLCEITYNNQPMDEHRDSEQVMIDQCTNYSITSTLEQNANATHHRQHCSTTQHNTTTATATQLHTSTQLQHFNEHLLQHVRRAHHTTQLTSTLQRVVRSFVR